MLNYYFEFIQHFDSNTWCLFSILNAIFFACVSYSFFAVSSVTLLLMNYHTTNTILVD